MRCHGASVWLGEGIGVAEGGDVGVIEMRFPTAAKRGDLVRVMCSSDAPGGAEAGAVSPLVFPMAASRNPSPSHAPTACPKPMDFRVEHPWPADEIRDRAQRALRPEGRPCTQLSGSRVGVESRVAVPPSPRSRGGTLRRGAGDEAHDELGRPSRRRRQGFRASSCPGPLLSNA